MFADRFNAITQEIHFGSGDEFDQRRRARMDELLSLITEMEESGNLLGAGMIAKQSIQLFFGDFENMNRFGEIAFRIFERVLQDSIEPLSLVITHLTLAQLFSQFKFPGSSDNIMLQAKCVFHRRETADALIENYKDNQEKNSYLISGFNLFTNYSDKWDVQFVSYEIVEGHTTWNNLGAMFSIPGAFQLLVTIQDYERSLEIAEIAPSGFIYPGVCGWREVCRGFNEPEKSYDFYMNAAGYFASDVHPKDGVSIKRPYWSAFHSMTLAPYFRARAILSMSLSNPEEVIDAICKASTEIDLNASGFVYAPSRKLAILVHGLGSFIKTRDESVLEELANNYQREIDYWGDYAEDDDIILEGLELIARSIEGFRYQPVLEIQSGRLAKGIHILESIPEYSQIKFVSHIGNKFGASALEISQGATYSDVATKLGTIADERDLQVLVHRLLQAKGPYHSKVTHGPIEFGKDIVAVIEENDILRLDHYVVKAGDIDTQKWRDIKESIDQAFTVPYQSPQVTQYNPSSSRVYLVFNGHFNQYVDPVVDGWFNQLRKERNWDVQTIDLNGLSRWIVSDRLVRVFDTFLREFIGEESV